MNCKTDCGGVLRKNKVSSQLLENRIIFLKLWKIVCSFSITIQVGKAEETDVAQKVGSYNLHISTIDFTLENFDATYTRYKSMLNGE